MTELELPRRARPTQRAAVGAAALAAVWLAMLTVGAGAADGQVLSAIYAGGQPALIAVARVFTLLGDWYVVVGLSIAVSIWLIYRHHLHYGLAVFMVTLIGRGLVTAQKYGIERLRPGDEEHLVNVGNPSFPSGHAAGSMIVYLTIALVLTADGRWRAAAVTAALLVTFGVGLSRMMLGVHWPTDVVGGWAFGLMWVLIALPWVERFSRT